MQRASSALVHDFAAPVSHAQLWRLLTRHGSSAMAYSSLQPGAAHFLDEQLGYLAYIPIRHPLYAPRGMNVVIGDPIAAPADVERLLDAYLAETRAALTVFLDIGSTFADVLSARGYPVNEFGVNSMIDLRGFDLALRGKQYSHLRRWRNKAHAEGIEVHEGRLGELGREELGELNREWLARKGGHDLAGLTRPLVLEDEDDVRYFWARQQGRLLALAVFDPMYRDGRITGYLHNASRALKDAPNGTNDAIVLHAIGQFQAEGKDILSLGLSPLALKNGERYPHNPVVAWAFDFIYRRCPFIYPCQGNVFHKEKYCGRQEASFIAGIPALNLYHLLGILKALRAL
ncbi:phosphatidylglycerol lysyltransferase domain-containing protein [Pseudomonas borbori]